MRAKTRAAQVSASLEMRDEGKDQGSAAVSELRDGSKDQCKRKRAETSAMRVMTMGGSEAQRQAATQAVPGHATKPWVAAAHGRGTNSAQEYAIHCEDEFSHG